MTDSNTTNTSSNICDALSQTQPMIELDSQGRILNSNPLAASTLGYPSVQLQGRHYTELFTPTERP